MAQSIANQTPQEICINNHEGVYLVVAGPGVGKTYTVVKRIQKMIEKGIEAEKILCLTFSDTAAREMKSRVGENVNVNVFTYHSFCLSILEEFSEYFDSHVPKIITESHKKTLIGECIESLNPVAYNNEKNNPYQYTDDILKGIEEIKKNRISHEEDFIYNLENNPEWLPHLKELETKQGAKPTEIKALSDKIEKMKELWKFYKLYNKKMRELDYIDFYDMINIVLDNFENPNSPLLELVCEKYDYVIVDEYQDTNTAQNDIVFNLARKINNIFVVGDDDQIIYTFQGAHLDTIEKFLNNPEFKDNKKPQVLCFNKNYRSTQNILDLACTFAELQDSGFYKFMASKSGISKKEKELYETTPPPKLRFLTKCNIKDSSGNILSKKLTASNPDIIPLNKPIDFIEFINNDNERDYIVQNIIKLKNEFEQYNSKNKSKEDFKEKKLSEIAILTCTNKELKDFAIYLKANGVPVEITGGKNIFEIASVNCLITYLQFLTNPEKYSDKMLSFMLLNPYRIDPRDYKTIIDRNSHHKTLIDNINSMLHRGIDTDDIKNKLEQLIEKMDNDSMSALKNLIKNDETAIYNKKKLENFIETFEYLNNYISSESYKNALIEIASRIGIFEYYFSNEINKLENIRGYKKLLDVADAYFDIHKNQENGFKMFVDYLSSLMEGGIEIKLDKTDKPMNAVQLSTYHSSKGREFEYVFMPYLTKGKWESSKSNNKDIIPTKPIEGENYEDVTEKAKRAKFLDNIKLMYVGMTRAKHSLTLSYTKTDTRTHGELSWYIKQLLEKEELRGIINKKYDIQLEDSYIVPKYEYDYGSEFRDYIISKLPTKFSVSGLNAYRNCPKQYFYSHILELKSESGSQDDASFGTAMHSAFEYTIKYVMDNKKYPSANEVYSVFSKKLDNLICDYPDNLKKAAKDKIFSDNGYYKDFTSMVDTNSIHPDKKFVKKPKLDSTITGFSEIYAEYPLSFEIEIDNHKVILNGYIDRLDKDKNGSYSIYDYKSKVHCDSIAPSDNYFYQMAFYKYIFEHQHPNCKVTNATFLLPLEADGNHSINLIDKFDKAPRGKTSDCDKTNYEVKIEELLDCIKKIYNLEFEVSKKPNCNYCPYRQFCETRTI